MSSSEVPRSSCGRTIILTVAAIVEPTSRQGKGHGRTIAPRGGRGAARGRLEFVDDEALEDGGSGDEDDGATQDGADGENENGADENLEEEEEGVVSKTLHGCAVQLLYLFYRQHIMTILPSSLLETSIGR